MGAAHSIFSDILYAKVARLIYKIENGVVNYSNVFVEHTMLFLYSDTVNLIDESKNKHCIQHYINHRGSVTVCLRSYSWKPASICRWTSLLQPPPPPPLPLELEEHNFKNWKTLVLEKTNHRFFYFFDEMGRGNGFA